jgi:hypothetical protein
MVGEKFNLTRPETTLDYQLQTHETLPPIKIDQAVQLAGEIALISFIGLPPDEMLTLKAAIATTEFPEQIQQR